MFFSINLSPVLTKSIGLVSSFIIVSTFLRDSFLFKDSCFFIGDTIESISIIAIGSPTLTISLTSHNFFNKVPENSLGTSESTLSVAISTIKSSSLITSPSFLSQPVIVASSTLYHIRGKTIYILFDICENCNTVKISNYNLIN